MRTSYTPPLLNSSQQFVRSALEIGALELAPEGRMLKSGRISPYFFNAGRFTNSSSLSELGQAYASVIESHYDDLKPDVLFGPAYKGIPIAIAAALSFRTRYPAAIEWAHDRKEAKDHGEGGELVGATVTGKRVLIVDDVITTGGTKHEAVRFIEARRGTVVGVVIAFDRMERGEHGEKSAAQLFSEANSVPVFAAATLDDLIAVLESDTDFPNNPPGMLEKIFTYRNRYGARN